MVARTFRIPNEGHTLACMIRHLLFENGAEYAACVVRHPQDDFLDVEVDAESDSKEVLLSSLHQALETVRAYRATVNGVRAHIEAAAKP